jgi:NAD-dependent SIR2 family protein deacetylase
MCLRCHACFLNASQATCLQCGTQFPGKTLERDVLLQRVPICPICPPPTSKPPKKIKKLANPWDGGDDSESDVDASPKAILKVRLVFRINK